MLVCPHCRSDVVLHELPHPSLLADFRICPTCAGRFTVDRLTKRRQAVALCIAVICLVLTILLYARGSDWLIPALFSYAVLLTLSYWGNKRVRLVPYRTTADDE